MRGWFCSAFELLQETAMSPHPHPSNNEEHANLQTLTPFVTLLWERKWRWTGHILHRDRSNITRQTLNWNSTGTPKVNTREAPQLQHGEES